MTNKSGLESICLAFDKIKGTELYNHTYEKQTEWLIKLRAMLSLYTVYTLSHICWSDAVFEKNICCFPVVLEWTSTVHRCNEICVFDEHPRELFIYSSVDYATNIFRRIFRLVKNGIQNWPIQARISFSFFYSIELPSACFVNSNSFESFLESWTQKQYFAFILLSRLYAR